MLFHYVSLTFGFYKNNRLSSSLNLIGLSLGLAACILSVILIQYELSYDRFFSNHEKTIRISRGLDYSEGNSVENAGAPAPLAGLLEENVNAFEQVTRFWPTNGTALVTLGDKKFNETGVAQADENFFKVFNIPFLIGNPDLALSKPSVAVLSQKIAIKYFGNAEAAIGQTLSVYRRGEVQVTGVFADLPDTSHLQYDLVVSMSTTRADFWMFRYWDINFFHTYALMAEGVSVSDISRDLPAVAAQIPINEEGGTSRLTAWGVTDIHPYSTVENELRPHNAIVIIERFFWVSLLMILTSCFNYINMSTALAAIRSKEIAIKRVMGASRRQLILQFLSEAFITTLFAFFIAVTFVELGLGALNDFLGKSMAVSSLLSLQSGLSLFGIIGLVTLLSGGYPALTYSRINPASVLQGGRQQKVKHQLRQALVIIQFSIASALLLAISIVIHQNWLISNVSRGYNPDDLVVLANLDDAELNVPELKQQLLQNPDILNVGASTNIPTAYLSHAVPFNSSEMGTGVDLTGLNIGPDFFKTFEIEVLAGRGFEESRLSDDVNKLVENLSEQRVIINKLAAARFGWTAEQAIGKFVERDNARLEIIGIVEDIHFGSIREPLVPVYYLFNSSEYNYLTLRVTDQTRLSLLKAIDDLALKLSPISQPALRDTIENRYNALYADEQNYQIVLTFLSFLVVTIASIGLFALASFIIKNRTLEIAIRKVLGAKSHQIVGLMVISFVKLVMIANLIAVPFASWIMIDWLNQFTYRIEYGFGHIAVAAIITIWLAIMTTAGQSFRIARLKPVISLRQN